MTSDMCACSNQLQPHAQMVGVCQVVPVGEWLLDIRRTTGAWPNLLLHPSANIEDVRQAIAYARARFTEETNG